MKVRCLVLHISYPHAASYYDDWLDAFNAHPRLDTIAVNIFRWGSAARVAAALHDAELAVVLHSGTADGLEHVTALTPVLADRRCPLVVFVGNEFNLPWLPISAKRAWIKQAAADFIATQLQIEVGRWLYEGSGAEILSVPQALNPVAFRPTTPRTARRIDIGTRSFRYPIYIGDNRRSRFLRAIQTTAHRAGLTVDIDFDRRFDRTGWAAFLNSCRFTAATEAGSPFLERDDARTLALHEFLVKNRKGMLISTAFPGRQVFRHLPWRLREALMEAARRIGVRYAPLLSAEEEMTAEIEQRFFPPEQLCPYPATCISSRHFDAIGCGTAQLLLEGHYNGILTPDEHYISVSHDLSNIEAALQSICDPRIADHIAEAALVHALASHTHGHRIDALLSAVIK